MNFLDRATPFFKDDGFAILQEKTISFAGLGGVGGGAFLALVRCGASNFRIAENGVFDPPDMNRQAGAFGHTMDRQKIDVYVELARSINPDIKLETYPDGINADNLDDFLVDSDAFVAVIDVEKGEDVKQMTPALLEKHQIPAFTCGAIGFGALMVNYAPGGMKEDVFWKLAKENDSGGGLLPSVMQDCFSGEAMARMKQGLSKGVLPTTAIGGLASNALLANEVLAYLLADTGLVEREPIFAPKYVTLDFMTQAMHVADISE
ncbi:ThiF family adenylyltransferase [Pseudodesulfovibrio sp. zrk46]|uniref:ThiF family adenylyltransferase n=1 Tax=Pseudodesulfovibrio sp. zrk46 TaxID=2725288 RepID=UPI001448E873|nr:ThiF family adenylyltransferase [Pseudodesulfovibrio sp. zrk46]QJB57031.1 thiamine biosynthesis protein ThiF [Pseudodesulfovibrio sp. zrk46]